MWVEHGTRLLDHLDERAPEDDERMLLRFDSIEGERQEDEAGQEVEDKVEADSGDGGPFDLGLGGRHCRVAIAALDVDINVLLLVVLSLSLQWLVFRLHCAVV